MTWQWFEREDAPTAGQPPLGLPSENADPGALPLHRPASLHTAFEGNEPIAQTRRLARAFLTDLRTVHGIPVSEPTQAVVELVVSELITNTRKYAPGPSLLTLDVRDGCIEVSVWDSNPSLPAILPPDPTRVGQHGLEIVMTTTTKLQIQREPVGKRITASIPLTDRPAGDAPGP
ncbi:ATP-binding protein [Streptomyces sp. NPDC097619]|uniref:ATP-binding protein n=1 Tax=Streptomyces sp. NPDC097619 TaxID=3157228 RepID=UPI00331923E5